jgi:multiple sugar transport system substrate-binding protein
MGLNNQNLHNVLFRGLLYAWEQYTGAKINWIDLAQADYNARLQQSIATGTVDFDIAEMGAPFEGDVCGKGLASVMPDWVKQQIDMDDYVGYLKAPVGTWDGKTYRISVDGDCHNFNYRTDVFGSADLAKAWKDEGHGRMGRPHHLAEGQEVTKFLKGKQLDGQDLYGYLDAPKGWGGFGFYFLASRHGLCQASRRQGLAVRSRHDEAAHQQSGLGPHHPGRARRAAVAARRPAQRRPRHDCLPAVPGRHRLDGRLVG